MEFDKYTERSRGFVQAAQTLALRSNHQRFTPEHLLKVLLDDAEGLAANLIRAAGGDPLKASEATEAALAKVPQVEGGGGLVDAPLLDCLQPLTLERVDHFIERIDLLGQDFLDAVNTGDPISVQEDGTVEVG